MPRLKAFIGGIHGVGKSYFTNLLSNKLNIPVVSAGELIYNQRMVDKNVDNIDKNQDILIRAFSQLPELCYLMDGHYTLLDKSNVIKRIDSDVFNKLNPEKLILIKASPSTIKERLKNRDSKIYPLEQLELMQEEEEKCYLELCSLLKKEVGIIISEN